MKKANKILSVLMAVSLLSVSVLTASATSFSRKFNGVAGIDGKKAGSSTYKNGVVTMDLPDAGSLCWSYVPNATDLSFQFRVDVDKDPEFDWLGINITNDGYGLLGDGTGLSTIFFRTGDGYCSRVVEEKVMEWDAATGKELNNGSLYDDNNKAPEEGYAFGYGSWITFSMKKNGSKWDIKINGVDMVKNRYKGFDEDMTRLLGSGKITLSFFTSGVPGTVELKSYTPPADNPSSNVTSSKNSTPSKPVSSVTSGKPVSTGSTSSSGVSVASTPSESSQTTTNVTSSGAADPVDSNTQNETSSDQATLTDPETPKDKGNGGLIAGIVIAVVVVLAAGGIAAYLIVKKRKQ